LPNVEQTGQNSVRINLTQLDCQKCTTEKFDKPVVIPSIYNVRFTVEGVEAVLDTCTHTCTHRNSSDQRNIIIIVLAMSFVGNFVSQVTLIVLAKACVRKSNNLQCES